jgi:glycosyltransferase involved in cell wall biosynthesis
MKNKLAHDSNKGSDQDTVNVLHLRSSGAMLGAEQVVFELSKVSPRFGVRSIVGIPLLEEEPLPAFVNALSSAGLEFKIFRYSSRFSFGLIKAIRRFLRENNINIIHSHGYQEDFYAYFSSPSKSLIATNHLWKRTTLKLKFYAWIDANILRKFSRVVAVSNEIKNEMLVSGVSLSKLSVISNGIDTSKFTKEKVLKRDGFNIRSSLSIPKEAFLFGMVSSLTVEKGHRYAIEAFELFLEKSSNHDSYLIITGDGNQKKALIELVQSKKLNNKVIFLGSRSDIPSILAQLDVFVISSLIEGLPIALLEAMASSLPVIATKVGDISKVVIEQKTGFLTAPENVKEIADVMLTYVNSVSLRELTGNNACQLIRDEFSSLNMTKNYCDLYKEMLA